MAQQAPEAVVRRFISEIRSESRLALVDMLAHPQYSAHGEVVGRDLVRRNIARTHRGFSDLSLETTPIATDGDRVALMFDQIPCNSPERRYDELGYIL